VTAGERAAPPAAEVLARAPGVELLGEVPGSGYRRPPALARRADGQVVQLTPLLHQTLAAIDGRRTLAEVAEQVGAASGRLVRPEDVSTLVDSSLRPLGLLMLADGSAPEVRRSNPLLALTLRRAVTDPAVTRRLTAPFAVLFSPLVVVPVVLAFVAVSAWVLVDQGLAAATAQAFGNPALFLAVVVLTVLSAGFHEFGHAAAARYGGATPGVMGVGFYLFWPAFYTDVTDSYRLGRGGRVRTDLGGLYFNAVVVLLSFGLWWLTGWHAVLLLVATQILQMVRQLLPLLRFDGYHVLADLTGVPDLYRRIGPILKGLLPGHWREPEATALKPWARAVVVAWVLVVVPLMVLTLLLMVVALPRVLATAWASLQQQGGLLARAFGDGDVLGVLARALAVVAVVLPLLGLVYVVVRLVRRIATGVWRRTAGRPVRRGLALLLAVALVAAVGLAWWPDGDRYRPVRTWEGGTLLDVLPASSGAGLAEGSRGTGTTLWPEDAGPMPTEDHPALALVLVPAATPDAAPVESPDGDPAAETPEEGTSGEVPSPGSGGDTPQDGGGSTDGSGSTDGAGSADGTPSPDGAAAPTWVFPFDRPLPPGDGDNQALAVNTGDGSVRYDVSFALVWADGDTAVNRNEAYALASCQGCTTVAVAFQVVLLVGSVDVVVPQNIAAAVNYACLDCVTYALATQLVVSLDGPLDADGQRELSTIWAELQDLAGAVPTMPLAELQDRLDEYESRIVAVVRANGEPGTPVDGAGATATATATGTGTEQGDPAEPSTTAPATGTTEAPAAGDEQPAGSTVDGATSSAAPPSTTAPPSTAPATSASPTPAVSSEPATGSAGASAGG
jgi:putative peptide zinc metalloprotease protein